MKDAIIKILTEHPIYQQDKDEDGTLFDYTSNIDNSDAQSIADKIILYLTEHPPQTEEAVIDPNYWSKCPCCKQALNKTGSDTNHLQ